MTDAARKHDAAYLAFAVEMLLAERAEEADIARRDAVEASRTLVLGAASSDATVRPVK